MLIDSWRLSGSTVRTLGSARVPHVGHLTEIIKGLVTVAHHDPAAFREFDQLATEVFDLDGALARAAASYWNEPENTLETLGGQLNVAYTLQRELPHRVVDVLQSSKPITDD